MIRYGARPAFAQSRLSITPAGNVSYRLRRPWYTGQTHVTLDPVAFLRRLAALIPPARMHLTRFHGAFAPRSKLRRAIATLAMGASTSQPEPPSAAEHESDQPDTVWTRRKRMAWAKLLARVFDIDVTLCADPACGGKATIIAWITDPDAIEKILRHIGIDPEPPALAPARAPPQPELDFGHPH